jgi:hypothetical protein
MFCCWGLGCGLGEDGSKNPNKLKNTTLSEQLQNPIEKSQKEAKSIPLTNKKYITGSLS